ncbi:DUF2190 family protein [Deinococcus radiomollis]|uniref:capsid cement protein n=1 Tax=Deinococcus radiomollis TaxID=468916 RepID=UPI0038923671
MIYEKIIQEDTFPVAPGADLSAAQFKLVSLNASSQLVLANVTSPILFPVLDNQRPFYGPGTPPTPSQISLSVVLVGVAKVKTGGVIAAGDPITSDANGLAVKQTGTGYIVGYALYAAAVGDLVPLKLA